MANRQISPRLTALTAAIAGALLSTAASGQTTISCPLQGDQTLSCSLSGTYGEVVIVQPPSGQNAPVPYMYPTTNMDITAGVMPNTQAGLEIQAIGANGSSNGNMDGNGATGLTANNSGTITLTGSGITTGGPLYGLLANMQGGNAATSSNGDTGGQFGGIAGANGNLSLTNNATIDMTGLSATVIRGGAGVAALSQGGDGSSTTDDHNPSGAAGLSRGAQLANSGNVSVTVQGSERFAGLLAASSGGRGGDQYDGGSNPGGEGGAASVQNSGQIAVDWTWNNADTSSSSTAAVYGILAQSQGGDGGDATEDGLGNGGAGGRADSAVVTLNTGGSVSVTEHGTPPKAGAGVAAILLGGDGGNGLADEDHTQGGSAGDAGVVGGTSASLQINDTDTSVTVTGYQLPALRMWGQGGAGAGTFNSSPHYSERGAGNGGKAADASLTVTAASVGVKLSTSGDYSSGIQSLQQGGAGGNGGEYNGDSVGISDGDPPGNAGSGGDVGSLSLTLTGTTALPVAITTAGQESHGIFASLRGGDGGAGGSFEVNAGGGLGGNGGAGGSTGEMDLMLYGTSITTTGTSAFGILAQNRGANGGTGGDSTGDGVTGGPGGAGGSTGTVSVTLDNASSISTAGQHAIGLIAQSASGAGGSAGQANGVFSGTGGTGGTGGSSGAVSVSNAGKISTLGVDALGILAQSVAGAGGSGSPSYGVFDSTGGTGGSASAPGVVTVSSSGAITTGGDAALGIVAQSIGGSGGAGGMAGGVIVSLGGSASTNPFLSDGNTVTINGQAGGAVTTAGASAIGILAQSVGGGGGVGGGSLGQVSVGASGGKGGSGASVNTNLESFSIETGGDNAHGLVAQSIGGGGGNAGNANGIGVFASLALGQSGGDGGDGGGVSANLLSGSAIVTQGSKAVGMVAQSIGGGGGTGGRAFAGAVGPLISFDVAIGGKGGTGGNGGVVNAGLSGGASIATGQIPQLVKGACDSPSPCLAANQMPVDAFGAVVQSVGGGGGVGGNAIAEAAAIGVNVSENTQVSIAAAVSLGGIGGVAGNGNDVTFSASDGAQITTQGQGSHGVLIQSIGGGGGAGGDSSSMAASLGSEDDDTTSLSIDGSFALGADGASGGNGGSVWTAVGGLISTSGGEATFTADGSGTPSTVITTYGDYANGITAQSIGGGGGNAGFGSANTQSFGSGTNLSPSVALGATGGAGGNGGLVQVEVMPTGTVQTWGSGAIGVLAQSIGGGGGASQGGSFTISGTTSGTTGGMTLNLGNQGGSGNVGGTVDVAVSGTVATNGGDAPAVQAQSIGGGGGQGGSAGSDASSDNPVIQALHARSATSTVAGQLEKVLAGEPPDEASRTFKTTLSIGGTGGEGNVGGSVGVTLNDGAKITTEGDWSTGIFAQSVGGGGGKGGNGLATGTGWVDPSNYTLSTSLGLGGNGGVGADGGAVTASLNGGAISTSGFGAEGILAQSVGGGGGHGADGSDGFFGTVVLGMTDGGNEVAGGAGGAVTLTTSSNQPSITTHGEAGFGVLLQSVGGGGGFAGVGSSVSAALGNVNIPNKITLTASNNSSQAGSGGGDVELTDNVGLNITTSGNNAFGAVAQSVAGGGGVIINSQNQLAASGIEAGVVGSLNSNLLLTESDGGNVTVNFASPSAIRTSGTGAHGLIAQSVGGGGGIVGLPGTATTLSVDWSPGAAASSAGVGSGGDVSVTANGTISLTGAGAIGILAQSVSGAGGLILADDGQTVYAGNVNGTYSDPGSSKVNVTVGLDANVYAEGVNGIGIFAQNANSTNGVALTVDGTVSGGASGSHAAAIWVDSSQSSTLDIGDSGTVFGNDGYALLATTGELNGTNSGYVQGNVSLNNGTMTSSGLYVAGTKFEGNLINSGLTALGNREGTLAGLDRERFATTTLTGTLTQTEAGTLQVGADFNTLESDKLVVDGTANLGGGLRVAPRALLPNRELEVLNVNGRQSGALTAIDSPIFDYEARQAGNATHIRVAGADFNAPAMQLKSNQANVAGHLQRDWDAGGSAALSTLYAALDTASSKGAGEYRQRVSDLSPGVALAPAAQMQFGMARFTSAMMSCPTFVDTGTLTKEQDCFWGEVTSRHTNQDEGSGSSSFSYDSQTYQFGGQRKIAPNWYLGGSVAYQDSRLRGDDSRVGGSGDSGYAGIVLKREAGEWTFSGALGGGYGSFDLDRNLNIQSFDNKAKSSPDVYGFGARLRAARTFTYDNFYLKPYVDLTASYSRMPAYKESGDALSLKVDSSDQFVLGLAPTLEVGGRVDLPKGAVLRPFAYAGVSLLSEDGWKTDARLRGAAGNAGSFTTEMPTDNFITRVGAGIQVMKAGSVDFRLQYDGEFAGHGSSHAGALKLAVPF